VAKGRTGVDGRTVLFVLARMNVLEAKPASGPVGENCRLLADDGPSCRVGQSAVKRNGSTGQGTDGRHGVSDRLVPILLVCFLRTRVA